MVRNLDHDNGQNPNFLRSAYIHLNMTIGEIAGCQWPCSFCNHDHARNIRGKIVKILTMTIDKIQISRGQNGQPEI